jgi:hypothetical protein
MVIFPNFVTDKNAPALAMFPRPGRHGGATRPKSRRIPAIEKFLKFVRISGTGFRFGHL